MGLKVSEVPGAELLHLSSYLSYHTQAWAQVGTSHVGQPLGLALFYCRWEEEARLAAWRALQWKGQPCVLLCVTWVGTL